MQRPHVESRAEQRQTVADKAPAQFVEHFYAAVDVGAFAQDPASDLPARYWCAQAGVGAFGAKEFFAAQARVGRDIQGHAGIHSRNTEVGTPDASRYARINRRPDVYYDAGSFA